MDSKERIKAYFEEAIQTDTALKEVYDESRLNECWAYIYNQAKKQAKKSNSVCIEDAEVFKWARDFYYGDFEKEETKSEEVKTSEQAVEENKEETSQEEVPVVKEDLTTEEEIIEYPSYEEEEKPAFDSIEEFNSEKLVIEKVEEETKAPSVKEKKSNGDEQQWLFDFE